MVVFKLGIVTHLQSINIQQLSLSLEPQNSHSTLFLHDFSFVPNSILNH